MEIRRLDKANATEAEIQELARMRTLTDPRRHRDDPAVTPELARDELRGSTATIAHTYFGLFDGERMIGLSESYGALNAENTDICELGIFIDPERLGQGHHRTLFDHCDAYERALGRTRYWGWGTLGYEPSRAFWEDDLGFELAQDERISRCDFRAVDKAMMAAWRDRASERAAGYHLVRATSPFSDEELGYYAQGLEAMNDAPLDDLVHEPDTFDAARAHEFESTFAAMNSELRVVFVIETATGELAGYTSTRVPRSEPAYARQGDTVTVAAHRNQGIGRWLKADMWFWLHEERPEVRFVDTGNAESNRPMLAINEAMGFRDIMHHAIWHLPPPSSAPSS